jgi:hypothetical protein
MGDFEDRRSEMEDRSERGRCWMLEEGKAEKIGDRRWGIDPREGNPNGRADAILRPGDPPSSGGGYREIGNEEIGRRIEGWSGPVECGGRAERRHRF